MKRFCPNCGNKLEPDAKFCASCGNSLTNKNINNSEHSKKEIVLGKEKKSKTKVFISLFYVVVLLGSLVVYFATTKTKEEQVISEQPEVTSPVQYPLSRYDMQPMEVKLINGKIILPLDEVLKKIFVRFVYKNATTEIPLLAYINENGTLVTSISMCEPCNSTTFHIIGGELICNSCGSTWDLNNLEEISGSCGKYPPDPIPSSVNGNQIQIDESDILSWKRRV